MRFYKLDIRGKTLLQRLAGAPGYVSADEARLLYDQGQDQIYYGCDRTDVGSYVPLFDAAHDLDPIVGSTYKIGDVGGTFLEIHSDDFFGDLTGDVTGDVAGDLTGDVYSGDGLVLILNNGSDGTDALFRGNVSAEDTNTILFSGTDRDNSNLILGSIYNSAGTQVVVDLTPALAADSTFAGTATKAKYA